MAGGRLAVVVVVVVVEGVEAEETAGALEEEERELGNRRSVNLARRVVVVSGRVSRE